MFKKNISVSSTHNLSGKDGKELRRSVLKAFPSLTEEQLAALLPGKGGLVMTKLSNRTLIYSLDGGNPLFFDPDGRGSLLPTVYALAVLPQLMPTLHTWSEVSGKVLGGADLFLQGVLAPPGGLPDFLAGSARTLSVPGNPAPFAVGKMAVSRTEAVREGMKGRGWTLLHSYGDLLWQLGDKAPPNEGFTPTRIFPVTEAEAPAEAEGGTTTADGSEGNGEAGGEGSREAAAQQLGGLQLGESGEPGAAAAAGDGAGSAAGAGEAPAGTSGAVDMDALLEAAVLAGLHTLKNADLPIQGGDFYTRHMLSVAKPEGIQLDLKGSKYKKLSKLLDKFEKDKVITQKVVRKQDCITAVNRSHPAYTGFAGMPATAAAAGGGNAGGGGGGASTSGRGGSAGGSKVQISFCYRAPSSLRPVFGEAGLRDKDRLYSEEEVAAALDAYAAAQGLASADGRSVKLDRLLHGSLYNKKEEAQEGGQAVVGELRKRLLSKLQLHHVLTRPSEQGPVVVVRKGQVKPVSISAERRFGRNITAVSHVESFALSADEMAGVFQRKFQTSCSTSKLPGKDEKDMEIMMQGDLLKQVAAFLTDAYGIPPSLIELKSKGK